MSFEGAEKSIGVIVITYKAVDMLDTCLPPFLTSPRHPKVLVVNSSSHDGTVERARELGADTLVIPRSEFNHGTTRERARHHIGTDIVVMVTPDVVPDSETIEALIAPIESGTAAVSYARQLPRDGADYFEAFPRSFNYPADNELRSQSDVARLGAYTFFCSNACAAWSNAALDGIGGFESTLSLEDTIAVAKLLRRGHSIAYCADAVVKHSHPHTLRGEFRRYFDTGYVRKLNRELLFSGGGDEGRGFSFATALLHDVAISKPALLPYAVLSIAAKFGGYKLGQHGHEFPRWLKRYVSGQDYYWQLPESVLALDEASA